MAVSNKETAKRRATSSQEKSWLTRVESIVAQSREIPMWGNIPPFPWEDFSRRLSRALKKEGSIEVFPGTSEWKKGNRTLIGMGARPFHASATFSPLKGSCSLVFPSEALPRLTSHVFYQTTGAGGFFHSDLQRGFFHYLLLEAMAVLNGLAPFNRLTPQLVDMPLTREDAYCIDCAVTLEKKETIWGRIICPTLFHKACQEHFTGSFSLKTPSPLSGALPLSLSLCIGKTEIAQREWLRVRNGDFILLDSCSYNLPEKRGRSLLTLDGAPLFQVELQGGESTILDYAHYEENAMEKAEDLLENPPEEMENPPSETSPVEKLIGPKEIPLSFSVEVGRISMSLDQLLTLKPGNVIDLSPKPELQVTLTIGGKAIASGYLMQIGEVIGVKIQEVGK